MHPKAILVIYQPQYRLKNNKYLLSSGSNIIGNNDRCQVHIKSANKYFSQQYVANIQITEDFMYIEALCDNMLRFKSNMVTEGIGNSDKKKQGGLYRFVEGGCRYIMPMQEVFYIGPYKAIVQVLQQQQLRRINNVVNIQNFSTPKGQQQQKQQQNKPKDEKMQHQLSQYQHKSSRYNQHQINKQPYQINKKPNNIFPNKKSQPKEIINDNQSDRTQKLSSNDDNEAFQPTLVIEDNQFVYQPTLVMRDDYHNEEDHYVRNDNDYDKQCRYEKMEIEENQIESERSEGRQNMSPYQQLVADLKINIQQNRSQHNEYESQLKANNLFPISSSNLFHASQSLKHNNNNICKNNKYHSQSQQKLSLLQKPKSQQQPCKQKSISKSSQQILYQKIKKQQLSYNKNQQYYSQSSNYSKSSYSVYKNSSLEKLKCYNQKQKDQLSHNNNKKQLEEDEDNMSMPQTVKQDQSVRGGQQQKANQQIQLNPNKSIKYNNKNNNSINKVNIYHKDNDQDIDIDDLMPPTIKQSQFIDNHFKKQKKHVLQNLSEQQQQMPPTITENMDDQISNKQQYDEDQMPPTINEDFQQKIQINNNKKGKNNILGHSYQTEHYLQQANINMRTKPSLISYKSIVEKVDNNEVEDILDLLAGDDINNVDNKRNKQYRKDNNKISNIKINNNNNNFNNDSLINNKKNNNKGDMNNISNYNDKQTHDNNNNNKQTKKQNKKISLLNFDISNFLNQKVIKHSNTNLNNNTNAIPNNNNVNSSNKVIHQSSDNDNQNNYNKNIIEKQQNLFQKLEQNKLLDKSKNQHNKNLKLQKYKLQNNHQNINNKQQLSSLQIKSKSSLSSHDNIDQNLNFTPQQQLQQQEQYSQQKLPRKKRLFKQGQKKQSLNKQPPKLVNITGLKLSPSDKLTLKKKGYHLVPDNRLQQYDVLLVDTKITHSTQKLLVAIILDKPIVTIQWLHQPIVTTQRLHQRQSNTNNTFVNKKQYNQLSDSLQKYRLSPDHIIDGIKFSTIQNQRGNIKLFSSSGLFYFTQSLKLLEEVLVCAGGQVTKQLNKRKKLNLIINCELQTDQQFYLNNQHYKNWKFYSKQLIKQTIIIGQIIWKKYLVDTMSF